MASPGRPHSLLDLLYPLLFALGAFVFVASVAAGVFYSLEVNHSIPGIEFHYGESKEQIDERIRTEGYEAVVAELRMAASIDYTKDGPLYDLLRVSTEKSDVETQIYALERLVVHRHGDPRIHNDLATLFLSKGDVTRALEHLDIALRLYEDAPNQNPNLGGRLHASLGGVLLTLGRKKDAADHYRKALELDPTILPARDALKYQLEGY